MSDIFVSYKKDDRAIAERLVAALRAEGKSVWWDEALSPVEAWDSIIEKEIAASSVVLVLWSPRSVNSDWVRSEAHYAQDHHKLVPVLVEPCSIPLAFRLRQAVDLSDGRFDHGNPNWERLLSWIDAIGAGDHDHTALAAGSASLPAAAAVAAAAAIPAKVASGDRWLGPARRPQLLAVLGVAVLALVAGALFLARGQLFAHDKPAVYVDDFTVARDAKLDAGFAQTFADEVSSQLNAASLITPLEGDGKPKPNAYRMTGDIRFTGGKYVAFAKIFAPGIAAPVLSPKIEYPEAMGPSAAKLLAVDASSLLRCIATASDSSGSAITVLPEAAIRPWAQYCQQGVVGTYDTKLAVGYLRAVVAADPGFANGWANIAETLGGGQGDPGTDPAAITRQIREAYGKALEIDADNQKAMAMKALDKLGLVDVGAPGSAIRPLANFAEFDELIRRANEVRPSDCGCEAIIAGQTLTMLGRPDAALPYSQKVMANDPSDLGTAGRTALLLEAIGRSDEAQKIITDSAAAWPGVPAPHTFGFVAALGRRDWTAAGTELALTDLPIKAPATAVVAALKAGNRAAVEAAVQPLLQKAAVTPTGGGMALTAILVAAGHAPEALAALRGAIAQGNFFRLQAAWLRGMEPLRALPEFAQLTRQLGLPAYWKLPGHRPPSCTADAAMAYCRY